MQIAPGNLVILGEFTYRFMRFERYLVDSNHFQNRNGTPSADFKKYYQGISPENPLNKTDFTK